MIVHLVVDGVMEGALGLGLDVIDTAARLARAGRAGRGLGARTLTQRVVSPDGRPVRSVQGRAIAVEGAFDLRTLKRNDVLVLPGIFATRDEAIERLLARAEVRRVVAALPRAAGRGAVVAASCSATFLVAAAGLLERRTATTTWWLLPSFARRHPAVTLRADRMVVDGGGVLTAGSAFAHADLMLAVVARVAGPALADLVARYLVLDARPSQSQYMVLAHLQSLDPLLGALEAFITANLTRQVTLADLGRAVGVSPRTLARRVEVGLGLTPQRFVQRLRVAHAAHLLETTRLSIDEIAARVGYADPAAFRRAFHRHVGTAPGAHRRHDHPGRHPNLD
jgi:transcriptional regulator GlxA family with amidase domain